MRAVRRLAEQDVAGVADPLEQRIQVCGVLERGREREDFSAEVSGYVRLTLYDTLH